MVNQGYEIGVSMGGKGYVLCVDERGIIRSRSDREARRYFSNCELWVNEKGIGILEGEMGLGKKITARYEDGDIIALNGLEIKDLEVKTIFPVEINQMISDVYVAGLQRPIVKPNSYN
ncbi:MAG: hypothetical protein ABIA78_04495 [archaeon]